MASAKTTPYAELPTDLRAYVDSDDLSDKMLAASAGWGLDRIAGDRTLGCGPARAMAAARIDPGGADAFAEEADERVRAVLACRGLVEAREEDGELVRAAAAERESAGRRFGKGFFSRTRGDDDGRDDEGKRSEGKTTQRAETARTTPAPARKAGGAR